MRIDLNAGPQALPETDHAILPSGSGSISASNGASGAASGVAGQDQAELSGAHAQVQALAAQAAQLPEVRQERVQSLRQAIQSGVYHSTPEQIAGAVFEHMISGAAA
jgi:flagellar biosynthesis anti-sigma factor FlgM